MSIASRLRQQQRSYKTPQQVLEDAVNTMEMAHRTHRTAHIQFQGPVVDNIRDNGTNEFLADIDWQDGAKPDIGAKFVFNPQTQKWAIFTQFFPSGRTGTKYFLQYDHEFPLNLCQKMDSMDASEAYRKD